MKAAEVKKLRDEEIAAEAARLRKKLYELRAQTITEKIKDSSQFKKNRQLLARLLTERTTRMKKVTT
ncbi:MAG: 50S ribosomal protein L29 [Planctomycetota bacterium]|jgi:ribosomal protein L29|nr:50S ribosomal protein L29 [Planctomycetota bacterium]MSR03993.1 50S ribosomal protein L29 [Phycisphaerales bacterium]PHX78709.1 MAG: 50S ribosomal protein L29 [Planctomycetaceae bacterium]NBX31400.1 50S ribosomal protein L29 [Planctomycetota bacterium]RLS23187.1 MAG: 50S ribosomal protein L29 [Planctomycetota bacterium]